MTPLLLQVVIYLASRSPVLVIDIPPWRYGFSGLVSDFLRFEGMLCLNTPQVPDLA